MDSVDRSPGLFFPDLDKMKGIQEVCVVKYEYTDAAGAHTQRAFRRGATHHVSGMGGIMWIC